MGWCSGTESFDVAMDMLFNDSKSPEEKIKYAINVFENMDWDCQSESAYYNHPLVKKVFMEIHPNWFEEDK